VRQRSTLRRRHRLNAIGTEMPGLLAGAVAWQAAMSGCARW